MWKPAGVVGLWLVLIAVPHFGSSAKQQVTAPGAQVATTVSLADPAEAPPEALPAASSRIVAVDRVTAPEHASIADRARGADDGESDETGDETSEAAASSYATVRFKNSLDKTLTLLEASFEMDGEALPPPKTLAPQFDNVIFKGPVTPGQHVVTTHLTCRGSKRGGVFTYMKDYRWEVRSQQVLTVPEKRAMVFTISSVRRRGMSVPLDQQVEISVFNELLPEQVSSTK
jgi:hypothetical protein